MQVPISFEFFPAKTELGKLNLSQTISQLQLLNPEYMSVTYGAGGSTKAGTLDAILDIKQKNIPACPHISCIGTSRAIIKQELTKYKNMGINQLVALRGDLPENQQTLGDFNYANELVAFIRQEFGDYFTIRVAAYPEQHPEAKDFYADFDNFHNKIKVGADYAITQYIFNPDAYWQFMDQCQKQQITVPIVPGIMPITNYKQLANFSAGCGAEIPRWLTTRLEYFNNDLASLQDFGIEVISKMCEGLIDGGAPALHFYSMNKSKPCQLIIDNLG